MDEREELQQKIHTAFLEVTGGSNLVAASRAAEAIMAAGYRKQEADQ